MDFRRDLRDGCCIWIDGSEGFLLRSTKYVRLVGERKLRGVYFVIVVGDVRL